MKRDIKSYLIAVSVLLVMVGFMLVPYPLNDSVLITRQDPRFVISTVSYTFPIDIYGNNCTGIGTIETIIDGEVMTQYNVNDDFYNTTRIVDSAVTNVTLEVAVWINGTFWSVSTLEEAKNIVRVNVAVSVINGTVIYSHTNMTYKTGLNASYYGLPYVFWLSYWLELDITPLIMGEIYSISVTYQVFGPDIDGS